MLLCVGAAARPAGASTSRATFDPVVVQSRRIAVIGHTVDDGVAGPRTLHVSFRHPTRRGTLLVAAIIDGVVHGGMTQPDWRIEGWRRGAGMIGGQLGTTGRPTAGGLQSVILFDPDNRGGATSLDIGQIPAGTITCVTVVLAELRGVPEHLRVVGRGGSTNGPAPSDYTNFSSISAASQVTSVPNLVLVSFTNGGTAPDGERFVFSKGWRVLGADYSRNETTQPMLFDERVWRADSRPSEWMRYLGGAPIDNCAAMVVLH